MSNHDPQDDFNFYATLFLSYYSDVDRMAYDKKRAMLSRLFSNMCVIDAENQENSASRSDSADFADLE